MAVSHDVQKEERCFVVRPNASLSRQGALALFLGLVFLSTLVALRFVLLGAWLVVPFTVLELALIGAILWLVLRRNQCTEMIVMRGGELRVIRQQGMQRREWTFQPYWVRIMLLSGRHPWYPGRLIIRSHGQSVEVGACLTEPERESLAKALRKFLPSGSIESG